MPLTTPMFIATGLGFYSITIHETQFLKVNITKN